MHNTRHANTGKTLETLAEKLEAARKAAHKFTLGSSRETREDACQDAQLAVLEYHAAGKTGTFSYFYGVAWHRLMDLKRAETRRTAREATYMERQYGYDATHPAVLEQ
jgi:DNA-directed RNA polymerase specialized sigma24 family protein